MDLEKGTFISSVSPYPEEEYYLGKSSWSTTAADWDQRFEVGDVIANPSGSWEPGTAEAYIDQQVGILNTNLTQETIGRQTGDRNLQTQLQSEMATRADQDANLNALINAGIREGGGVQFDIVPTQNSANGITSGGMYSTLRDANVGFVDDEPTAGSDNLVKSDGIATQIGFNAFDVDDLVETSGIGISANNGTFDGYQWGTVYRWIPVSEGTIINYKLGAKSTHLVMAFYTAKDASTYIANSGIAGAGGDNYVTGYTIVPTGAKYMAISIITGTANNFCFVGVPSLVHQYIDENNTFIGAGSMKRVVENSTRGVKMNVAIGVDSLGKITSTGTEDDGCYNVAVGHSALKENTTGNHNTGVGFNAAKETTTGSFNTAIGEDAMFNATTGEKNTCVGTYSGRNITQGERNICIGFNGGGSVKAGGSNILIGSYAGQPWNSDHTHDVEDDSNLIMIGGFTSKDVATTLQNAVAIGQGAKVDKSYQCVLGSSEIIEFILGNKILVFNQDGTVTWVSR